MFAKYDAALLTATLDTMMDIIYCPRRSCQYPVTLEQDETMGRCPSCQYNFCIYCKMAFHGLEPCRLKTGRIYLVYRKKITFTLSIEIVFLGSFKLEAQKYSFYYSRRAAETY